MEGPTDGDEPVLCKFKDVGREHILAPRHGPREPCRLMGSWIR
ncbi:hypothetical protein FOFC_01494 [Fusarium oxysporum]|nr:hypothetical protein FOFC_01494 [Fusarium oxysporum]